MVFDRETGKPKGYGFCEYKDTETAQSAIRNLNNVELGGRNLRVDIADSPNVSSSTNSISSLNNNPSFTTTTASSSSLLNAVESINTTLSSLTSTQLLDLLSQMKVIFIFIFQFYLFIRIKSLIASSPDAARHLLNSNPQLSYALLQSMLILGIVDVNAIQNLSSPQNMQQSFEPTSQMIQQQPTSQLPSIEQQRVFFSLLLFRFCSKR